MVGSKIDAISVLNTDTARLYTHIHPFIVLSGYFFNFASIVTQPVSSLSTFLIPLSILQIAYVVICLPATGSQTSTASKGNSQKKGSKSKTESLSSRVTVRNLLTSIITLQSLTDSINSLPSSPLPYPSSSERHYYPYS
jgi:phosphatidylinositol glycan class F